MLLTLTDGGDMPLTTEEAKSHLKIDDSAEDKLLRMYITAVVEYAEKYTSRDMRDNTYQLLLDTFGNDDDDADELDARIELRRNPVASVTTLKYSVAAEFDTTVVLDTTYYLKNNQWWSELLLLDGKCWPVDGKDALTTDEHTIEVVFVTEAAKCLGSMRVAMLNHLAHLYSNRGDCSVEDAAAKSGAQTIYDLNRIPRI